MTPDFREQAASLFVRDEYIYWLDDTHWNGKGIREAAQAITNSKTVTECPCQSNNPNSDTAIFVPSWRSVS